jgi:hypothetical protein
MQSDVVLWAVHESEPDDVPDNKTAGKEAQHAYPALALFQSQSRGAKPKARREHSRQVTSRQVAGKASLQEGQPRCAAHVATSLPGVQTDCCTARDTLTTNSTNKHTWLQVPAMGTREWLTPSQSNKTRKHPAEAEDARERADTHTLTHPYTHGCWPKHRLKQNTGSTEAANPPHQASMQVAYMC